jgi:hypothetical protein
MSSNLAMPSRRRALRIAGSAAAVGAVAVLPAPYATGAGRGTPPTTLEGRPRGKPGRSRDAKKYAPGRYGKTKVLPRQARHLLNRFSFGITPDLVSDVRKAGGRLAWFDQQLATAYDGSADGFDWWPDLHLDAATVFKRQTDMVRHSLEVGYDIGSRTLVRRLHSPRPVLEVMTKFWENHLHVPLTADNVAVFRAEYGETIRAGALGRYDELLVNAVLHPAMLMYLGNASSTKVHPNENLGRELLELHTVGLGNHTEVDVKTTARILTGWRIKLFSTWEPYYSAADHWTGPVDALGFSDANAAADGQELTRRYLRHLAHHPATARRIATKLVKVFVSDDVPVTLVDRLADVYLASDTDIKPVLRALVRSPEFRASVDRKVRDADDDVVAAHRLLGVRLKQPRGSYSHANNLYWASAWLGLAPLTWPRPDGQPVDNRSWSSPTRVLASVGFHWELANREFGTQVHYPPPSSFLPASSMEFRDLVDHLSRQLLQRRSTPTLLKAACLATGLRPKDRVDARSPVFKGRWPAFVTTFLDTPDYFKR